MAATKSSGGAKRGFAAMDPDKQRAMWRIFIEALESEMKMRLEMAERFKQLKLKAEALLADGDAG